MIVCVVEDLSEELILLTDMPTLGSSWAQPLRGNQGVFASTFHALTLQPGWLATSPRVTLLLTCVPRRQSRALRSSQQQGRERVFPPGW